MADDKNREPIKVRMQMFERDPQTGTSNPRQPDREVPTRQITRQQFFAGDRNAPADADPQKSRRYRIRQYSPSRSARSKSR